MKKYSTIVLLGLLLSGCSAIAQSSAANKVPIYGEHIVVRAYDSEQEIIFGYGMPPQASPNPSINANMKRTTIAIRTCSNNYTEQIAELPVGYKVFDAQILTLREIVNGAFQPVDFCVFCGTKIIDNGYWVFSITGNPMWVSDIDSTGFVGLFYLTGGKHNPDAIDYVYLRQVEGAKHLFKLVTYSDTNGAYYTTCGMKYKDNAVLDIIGLPVDSINRASCVTRVKFYPDCNGSIRWDNNIRTPPANVNEIVTDITGTDIRIATTSIFPNDTQTVYLRRNLKERYNYPGGMQFSNSVYKLNLANTTILSLPYNVYFKKPVRLTHLTNEHVVVSFIGANIQGSNNACNGLFSFRVSPATVLAGAFDSTAGTLVDVCRYIDTIASVALIETSPHNYRINTLRWSLNSNTLKYPVFSLSDTSRSLQSIDTRKQSYYNTQSLMVGGLIGTVPDRCWKLLDQDYFNSIFSLCCFPNSIKRAPQTSVGTGTMSSAYPIYQRYPHDPIKFPMTVIAKTHIPKSLNAICSEP